VPGVVHRDTLDRQTCLPCTKGGCLPPPLMGCSDTVPLPLFLVGVFSVVACSPMTSIHKQKLRLVFCSCLALFSIFCAGRPYSWFVPALGNGLL